MHCQCKIPQLNNYECSICNLKIECYFCYRDSNHVYNYNYVCDKHYNELTIFYKKFKIE